MRKVLLAAGLMLGLSGPTRASSECSSAVDAYNSAVDEISSKLKRYAGCVEGSRGTDDCSYEFRRLKSAQYDFESAVSSFRSNCG